MRFLLILFIVMPVVEITLLIQVGQVIGVWNTVGLVLLSAFIGVNMLRHQGLSTLLRARTRLEGGELPAQEVMEGLLLAVGGALLLTPGFVTDAIGFSCLIPHSRRALVNFLKSRIQWVTLQHPGGSYSPPRPEADEQPAERSRPGAPGRERSSGPRRGEVIDGEYRRDDE